jgi:hypothetical protein
MYLCVYVRRLADGTNIPDGSLPDITVLRLVRADGQVPYTVAW